MSDGLFSTVELATNARPGYRLHQVEVFNWGTFDKFVWRLTPGGDTSLLTGDIGSGKSTLVDAVTTLLLPANKISYNKAAGAEAKERTLRSYVEGHFKSERNEATGASRPIGLRQGSATYSVILGVFVNDGYDETVTLAQVFQQRDRNGQPYRFYVTSGKGLSIDTDFSDFGSDLNDLRKRLRAAGADISDGFPQYATSLRRRLGIRSEQAMELFHQTVSMKSVGNLNEFVRDHMLEPSDATERVRGIIGHFDDLTKSHELVIKAREQLDALAPLVTTADKYDLALAERELLEKQRGGVRLFVSELRLRLLSAEIEAYDADAAALTREQEAAQLVVGDLLDERESLIEKRAQAGGDRIGELERQARDARTEAEARRRRRAVFDDAVVAAELTPVADSRAFTALAATVSSERDQLAAARPGVNDCVARLMTRIKELDTAWHATDDELTSLQQRTSNLPASHLDLREQLCGDLDLSPDDLPFAGELLDVADEQAAWRGAAERVLRGFALSLLVPQAHYEAVAAWVNGRRLTFRGRDGRAVGTKLVYERVTDRRVPLQRGGGDGLILSDCLIAKDGPFSGYLLNELTRRADFVCVDTVADFRRQQRAVTLEGQVRAGERHEKDDRAKIDDPRNWVLGWANERKIEALRVELAGLEAQRDQLQGELATAQNAHEAMRKREIGLDKLADYTSWTDLDHAAADARAAEVDAERARLEAGSSELEEIKRSLARNESRAVEVKAQVDQLTGRIATLVDRSKRADRERGEDEEFVSSHPAEVLAAARASYDALTDRLGERVPTRSSEGAAAMATLAEELDRQFRAVTNQINSQTGHLIQYMNDVLRRWPELRSEMDADVAARDEFRKLHDVVKGDDLPRFEAEFKRQLNTNTIHELAGFNTWLKRQSDEIGERVARINEALGAIDYSDGRYIRLEHKATTNQDVQTFRTDLRNATDNAVASEDDAYSEQRFFAVKKLIERFRGREGYADADKAWTRRVTDVRNWFTFSASERDRKTDEEWEHYTDSDGKSGGQKEKLAYTILAASLAYQFGLEWGAEKSRDFRFAVIDEAFGRGSDASTRYALDLFAKLGLQLLIVTPLQKVHIIEPYVKAIGFVTNPAGTRSTVHTLTIEEFHNRRAGHDR